MNLFKKIIGLLIILFAGLALIQTLLNAVGKIVSFYATSEPEKLGYNFGYLLSSFIFSTIFYLSIRFGLRLFKGKKEEGFPTNNENGTKTED